MGPFQPLFFHFFPVLSALRYHSYPWFNAIGGTITSTDMNDDRLGKGIPAIKFHDEQIGGKAEYHKLYGKW